MEKDPKEKNYSPETQDSQLNETSARRLARTGLSDAVLGGLAYLFDAHVHDKSDYAGSYLDYLTSSDKAKRFLPCFAAKIRWFLGKYFVKERHLQGSWPAYIHLLVSMKKTHASPLIVVTDYNLMTTASTAYSLMLFDDRHLPGELRFIGSMLASASSAIRGFRRDGAHNFWTTHNHKRPSYACSAPLNIPLSLVAFRRWLYKYARLFGLKNYPERLRLGKWVFTCFDKRINPSGGAAVFNIPNDADNTSMAAGFQLLYHQWLGQTRPDDDIKSLEILLLYRDRQRIQNEHHSIRKEETTGAFLTWLKDEHLPIFSHPDMGIIPLGINNVDPVINANALFALSLAGKDYSPGFKEAVSVIVQAVERETWQEASHYYPQKYVFPYVLSRAWCDGEVRIPELGGVVHGLMIRLLEDFNTPGNLLYTQIESDLLHERDEFVHSTALALATLLNLGRKIADDCGLTELYDQTIEKEVRILILCRKSAKPRQKRTQVLFTGISLNFWESGVLYSSSLHQLAHWRSHAQTTALVVEALAKYILAYDYSGNGSLSRRLFLGYKDHKWHLHLNGTAQM
jgi:hypothetical protein